jgi:hypothetical protein
MATEAMVDADTGEDVPIEEMKPKPRRGKTEKQEPARAGEAAPVIEETYPGPNEEPPVAVDDPAYLAVLEAAQEIFSEDMSPTERAKLEGELEHAKGLLIDAENPALNGTDEPTLIDKIGMCMAAITGVAKRGQNKAQEYRYQRATDVTIEVREEFIKHGLVLTTSTRNLRSTIIDKGGGKTPAIYVEIDCEFTITDGKDAITFDGVGAGIDSGDKGVYKAITGALKYGLRTLLLIPDEEYDPERARADEYEDRGQQPEQQIQSINITSASPQGVQQGGRQTMSTKPQLDAIFSAANTLMMDPQTLEAYIVSTLGAGPDLDPSQGVAEHVQALKNHVSSLSFADAGKLARGLVEAVENGGT